MEARFNARMNECKNQEEMVSYLLSCVPVIREYTTEEAPEEHIETRTVANLRVGSRKGVQRNDIYKKYMREVEDASDQNEMEPLHYKLPCTSCGLFHTKIMEEATSEEICTSCGASTFILGDEVGFKEEQEHEKNVIYSYKRENHFNEWISQFQAKESTSVSDEVIEQLRTEFKKQKIKDLSEITHEKVKGLLKKLNKSKYYEHVPYITTILNGIQPPTMAQALEDRLRLMFHKIQEPFERHKPANRKNFLSYSYVLYKFCELLGEDSYLPCFPLLKSKEKLYIQDQIWERICRELQWEYLKTA
jgi:hypothetical protein